VTRAVLLWVVLGLWVVAMAASAMAWTLEPTGDSFTRGLNRLMGFLGGQIVASILARAAWILARPFQKGSSERWFGRIPAWWSVALLVLIAGLIVYANISDPASADDATTPPATAPVTIAPTDDGYGLD